MGATATITFIPTSLGLVTLTLGAYEPMVTSDVVENAGTAVAAAASTTYCSRSCLLSFTYAAASTAFSFVGGSPQKALIPVSSRPMVS
jgi:hypothetical protein